MKAYYHAICVSLVYVSSCYYYTIRYMISNDIFFTSVPGSVAVT